MAVCGQRIFPRTIFPSRIFPDAPAGGGGPTVFDETGSGGVLLSGHAVAILGLTRMALGGMFLSGKAALSVAFTPAAHGGIRFGGRMITNPPDLPAGSHGKAKGIGRRAIG